MASSTRIIRDLDGIAHVRAASVSEAFRGQGFAAAEDRIWQIDFDRRRALGQLAAAVGPSGLASDTFHRRMDIAGSARATFAILAEETRDVLRAYAGGLNDQLAARSALPAEFELLGIEPEPFEPWHSIAIYQFRHLAMGTFETKIWRSGLVHGIGAARTAALWPEIDEAVIDPDEGVARHNIGAAAAMADSAFALAAFGEEAASNNFAISGTRTSTGRPLLAGDPHRAIDLPNVYWQNHVTCDGPSGFDVIGLSFPGVPGFPHFGHNHDVAWCITHGMADDQDVFVVGPADWEAKGSRVEKVPVAGSDPVQVECRTTDLGPVVIDDGDRGLAIRWTALAAPDTTADALVPMMRAGSVDELDETLRPWVVPVNNLLMADVSGAIAYRMRGRLAVRNTENGWTAVPGDAERAWQGFVDDADLPRWRDPAQGFLVTANNRISSGGPYVSHDFAHPSRATTLSDRLGSTDGWSVDDVQALLTDTYTPIGARFASRITALEPLQTLERRAQAILVDWDGHMDVDAPGAAIYARTRAELVSLVSHHLGLEHDRLPGVAGPALHTTMRLVNSRLAFWVDDHDLVPDSILATALRFAVRHLELHQGSDPASWRWGSEHTARFVHPLAAVRPDLADSLVTPDPLELGGDNECIWATSTAPPSTQASNGQVARYVFDVGDWDGSRWIVPHGVSGDPTSSHHLDQLEDWSSGGLRPMRFSDQAVDDAMESVTTLNQSDR